MTNLAKYLIAENALTTSRKLAAAKQDALKLLKLLKKATTKKHKKPQSRRLKNKRHRL